MSNNKREKPNSGHKSGGKAIRGRGGGHGTKPSQRRDQKIQETSNEKEYLQSKRCEQMRDKLGGLVDSMSNEQLMRIFEKHDDDLDETCEAILAGEVASDSDSDA
jgi:hypothetical protein